jgi:hypothetical protein
MMFAPSIIAGTSLGSLILLTLGKLGYDDPEEEYVEAMTDMVDGIVGRENAEQFARTGLIGMMTGINLKGSLDMKTPFPSDLSELFGAPQAVFKDMYNGFIHYRNGATWKMWERVLPSAASAPLKGYREHTRGVTKADGSPVFYEGTPLKANERDFWTRVFSFNPERISTIRHVQWRASEVRRAYQARRARISAKRNYLFESNEPPGSDDWAELLAEIIAYNEDVKASNPKYQIPPLTPEWFAMQYKRIYKPDKYEW